MIQFVGKLNMESNVDFIEIQEVLETAIELFHIWINIP